MKFFTIVFISWILNVLDGLRGRLDGGDLTDQN